MKKIQFLDNTLREGEQVPGLAWSPLEKYELFEKLCALGVDLLDIGIPSISKEDAAFCEECLGTFSTAQLGVSIRSTEEELELAASLGASEVYMMFPFSEIHIRHKFKSSTNALINHIIFLLKKAASLRLRVNLVAEDATRGSYSLLEMLCDIACRYGAHRLFLCDTVGVARPDYFGELCKEVVQHVGQYMEVGVHCHNDFGLATANTLAALENGALIASVTVNGLGERSGNAVLHQVAIAVKELMKMEHALDESMLQSLSEWVERISGIFLSRLEPMVGAHSFSHESGIHVDGQLKAADVYEPISPEKVGRQSRFVLGRFSGTHQIRHFLEAHGLIVSSKLIHKTQEWLKDYKSRPKQLYIEEMRCTLDTFYENLLGVPEEELLCVLRNDIQHIAEEAESDKSDEKENRENQISGSLY